MNKDYENFILEVFNKYKDILFINKYNLYFNYDNTIYLSSRFHHPYLNITINYSDKSIENWKIDKQDHECELIHEFAHVITDPLYSIANRRYVSIDELDIARENLTDHIAKIIIKHITPKL